jgi:fructose-bisphosphate aldolase class II
MNQTRRLFDWAKDNNRAIVAFNISNMETVQGIAGACAKLQCPAILQVSKGARAYTSPEYLTALFYAAKQQYKSINGSADTAEPTNIADSADTIGAAKQQYKSINGSADTAEPTDLANNKHTKNNGNMKTVTPETANARTPLILHLDHGDSFELCKHCIDSGFDSVMIDGSALPYNENVALTKRVADYAHRHGVWTEGELGGIFGIEDGIVGTATHYTDPQQARDFVAATGVDSLAISIGTAHGAYKYKPNTAPKLRLDILKEIHKQIPDTPLVLHGASSVIQEYVDTINKFGGKIENTVTMPETEIAKTIKYGVRKINIDSDIRLGITATIRQYLVEHPTEFDPRKYMGPARETAAQIAARKLQYYTLSNN